MDDDDFEKMLRESGIYWVVSECRDDAVALLREVFEAGREYEATHETCYDCGDDIPRWTRPETPPRGWPRCEPCRRQC